MKRPRRNHTATYKAKVALAALKRDMPRPVSDADLVLMRGIDELHLNFPFAGSRMWRDMLKLEGVEIGRKHVRTLMERIGIAAIYRKRNTSAPHPAHPSYPYLMKNLTIDRPNQAWASDITYSPMKRGLVYLVAIIDWATRRVLAPRISISMTADFCVEVLQEAIANYGTTPALTLGCWIDGAPINVIRIVFVNGRGSYRSLV